MKIALITGANKGIGLETAKQLSKKGIFVYIGSRDIKKGKLIVDKLISEGFKNIKAIELDVTKIETIISAKKIIERETSQLDILINNAGISGGFDQSALTSSTEQFREVFETNLYGVVSVCQTFVELLKKSDKPRIVNVSTAMASLTLFSDFNNHTTRFVAYQASKTALNMYTINLAYELRETNIKINAVCPGYTQTDFTGHQGTSSVEQAAKRISKYTLIEQDGVTGRFFSEEYFGKENCPW
ncbi:SDR family oxidoreductase [Flavobacterium jejuense]|uniref:SDR family oxidoreductase n=1 Tax=Flavobacterium jejuense TaxID=1544455 RepID=A0ABX0IN95_9FLAO|nr:SDR family oxidoreductase [Flavobacterium jejuense]NHN25274.1 SDR family oxidoreductase [Flavobacterium jejuense]